MRVRVSMRDARGLSKQIRRGNSVRGIGYANPNATQVLYVSPLKALSNDIHKNLETPLQGMAEIAKAEGIPLAPIRVAVRSGNRPLVVWLRYIW